MANTSGYVQAALAGADANYTNRDQLGASIRNLGSVLGERRVRKEDAAERQLIRDTEAENLAMDRKREKEIADLADKYNAFASLMEFKQQADEAERFAQGHINDLEYLGAEQAWKAGQSKLDRASNEGIAAGRQDKEDYVGLRTLFYEFIDEAATGIPDYADPEQYERFKSGFIKTVNLYNTDQERDPLGADPLTSDEMDELQMFFEDKFGPDEKEEIVDGVTPEKAPWAWTSVHVPSTVEAAQIGDEAFRLDGDDLTNAYKLILPKYLDSTNPEVIRQGVAITKAKNTAQLSGGIDETETEDIMALIDILNRFIDSGINTSKLYEYDPDDFTNPFGTD